MPGICGEAAGLTFSLVNIAAKNRDPELGEMFADPGERGSRVGVEGVRD
jgi:hypothetical protein